MNEEWKFPLMKWMDQSTYGQVIQFQTKSKVHVSQKRKPTHIKLTKYRKHQQHLSSSSSSRCTHLPWLTACSKQRRRVRRRRAPRRRPGRRQLLRRRPPGQGPDHRRRGQRSPMRRWGQRRQSSSSPWSLLRRKSKHGDEEEQGLICKAGIAYLCPWCLRGEEGENGGGVL